MIKREYVIPFKTRWEYDKNESKNSEENCNQLEQGIS